MQCRDYKFQYKLNDKNIVRIEAISDSVPSDIPKGSTIDGFPAMWADETIQWAAGSIVYIISTGDVYMADETGKFSKIKTPSSSGGGGTPGGGDNPDEETTYF